MRIENLLHHWHQSPDLLFSVHPVKRSLIGGQWAEVAKFASRRTANSWAHFRNRQSAVRKSQKFFMINLQITYLQMSTKYCTTLSQNSPKIRLFKQLLSPRICGTLRTAHLCQWDKIMLLIVKDCSQKGSCVHISFNFKGPPHRVLDLQIFCWKNTFKLETKKCKAARV